MMGPVDHSSPTKPSGSVEPEFESIRQTIRLFIQGIRDLNADLIGRAFHPQANSFSLTSRGVCVEPADQWPETIRRARADADHLFREDFTATIHTVAIVGTAATARVEWEFQTAQIIDFYNLLKVEGRWLIVGQVYSTKIRNGPESTDATA